MIVAIEAASGDLSVALSEADGTFVADDSWASVQKQSAELMPRLIDLLGRSGRHLSETTGVAVGLGPGSFTGLRVALALAKGIAFALRRPILGVPSLEAWLDQHTDAVAAVSRAGAREAYLLTRGEGSVRVVEMATLAGLLTDARIVAPGELAHAFGLEGAEVPRAAAAVARRAVAALEARPGGDDLRTLEPIYVRPPRGLEPDSGELVRWL